MRCWGLIVLLIWGQSVVVVDFGIWGDLWLVKELDMLMVIMQCLMVLEQFGEMGWKMDVFKEWVICNSLWFFVVFGIGCMEKYGSWLFDLFVRLVVDIWDNEGWVFVCQGEVMNLLQYVFFNQMLYFINGDDLVQVVWMKCQMLFILESKIIFVQGSILEMQKFLDSCVYFDQNGVFCQCFGIDQVLVWVSVVFGDCFLKVEFILVEEGRK